MSNTVPLLVIAGKPNVGKSTLFNRLSGKRISIVDAQPGVTRDIIEKTVSIEGRKFRVADTGGMEFFHGENDPLKKNMEEQVWRLFEQATCILLVVDGRTHFSSLDEEMVLRLRTTGRRVILVINKREGMTHEAVPAEFYSLGIPEILQVSATHGDGIVFLKELLVSTIPAAPFSPGEDHHDTPLRLAVVGRPNVGKSTLFNTLLGKERALVSDIPGTTRDAVESDLEHALSRLVLVDTAGLARRRKTDESVPFYASIRTRNSMRDAMVCILLIDSSQGITHQDKKIAQEIRQLGKGCLVFFNKIDIAEKLYKGIQKHQVVRAGRTQLPYLDYAVFLAGSALSPDLRSKILPEAAKIARRYYQTIPTSQLNKTVKEQVNDLACPMRGGKPLRIFYAYQESTAPPRFTFLSNFTGGDREIDRCVKVINRVMRENQNWEGVPITIVLKNS